MPRYDFKAQRLYIDARLSAGISLVLDRNHANYVLNVLRLKNDAPLLVFNGRDGEWETRLIIEGRKKAHLECVKCLRCQTSPSDLHLLFAPLKQARLDYMIQKAVEMGVSGITPILTDFTQVRNLKIERLHANAIEAAEQCGILSIPTIDNVVKLTEALENIEETRQIVFCDEGENSQNPLPILNKLNTKKLAVLIGPEGGFSDPERSLLRNRENVTAIPLGPRVLRADTAAVAALAIVQATLGDWQ